MPIYTHARQFPHLAGKSDLEIRELARRGMIRRPGLIRVMKLRNAFLILAMTISGATLARLTRLDLGVIFIIIGLTGTVFILAWNLVWVNTVVYRLTRDEVENSSA